MLHQHARTDHEVSFYPVRGPCRTDCSQPCKHRLLRGRSVHNASHIGCGNNGAFGPLCNKQEMVDINDSLKAKIIDSHNSKRNTLANGLLPGFKPAQQMATMKWDNELAYLASLNVKRCVSEHDDCHNTRTFRHSGQNLSGLTGWWLGWFNDNEELILEMIDAWWNEYRFATQTDVESYPAKSRRNIGHFTVMAAEKNVALGCAVIKYCDGLFPSLTMACNYARTNFIGKPMYTPGKTASKCKTGNHSKYTGLCSISEKYDVNVI